MLYCAIVGRRLQESCLSILYTVALENQNASVDLSERYAESEVLKSAFAAMTAHSTSVGVQSSATRLLAWIFTYASARTQAQIIGSKMIPEAIKFMHVNIDSVDLMRSASMFISALVDAHDAALCCDLVIAGAIEVCVVGANRQDFLEIACQTKCRLALLELAQYEQLAPTFRQCGGCPATQSPLEATPAADAFRACGQCHVQYYCSVDCQVC